MHRSTKSVALGFLLGASVAHHALGDEPLAADDLAFFENRIRPVLVEHCYECHSADTDDLGGKLLLDSRDGVRQGGESGPAVVEGDADRSVLIHALRYDGPEMPPDQPLPEAVIQDFVRWVERGAPDPRTAPAMPSGPSTASSDAWWSLQPPRVPPVPSVQDRQWPRDQLDRFVLTKIEAEGLQPAVDADSRMLVRRLYYDLIGLPPPRQAVTAFEVARKRDGPTAVEELVDSLLQSPRFGERWGRHWLDVARFGESNGNDGLGRNSAFPHAWRYRDYVIAAFNADIPYDQFLTEQIAGDLLPFDSPEERDRHLIATAFLALTAKPAKAMNENFAMDVVADQIDLIGRGVMGLSVACARCHDHKFDPVPTRDYYALAGLFTSTETLWGRAANEGLTAPATDLHVLQSAPRAPPPEDFVETVLVLNSNTGKPRPVPKPKWPPGTPLTMGVRDRDKVNDCKINIKGSSKKLGDPVPRGFLTAFDVGDPDAIVVDARQSGRLQLAQWLTHPDHPLTARVIVNRIWMHLFGEGIVRTPDDFGKYGEPPTHPELLDHLAMRFIQGGWSMKRLIRAIVLSRTYQLSSYADAATITADATNALLTRHNRRRLDAESLRDSMLQVSGQLDLRPADGSIIRHRDILINLAGNLHQPSQRRSVYLCYLRSSPPPELAAFDLPEFTAVTGRRDVSTVPGQALHLYNSPFVIAQAEAFAERLAQSESDEEARIRRAFHLALGRQPSALEFTHARRLVAAVEADTGSEIQAWASVCQALMISNEFRYVD